MMHARHEGFARHDERGEAGLTRVRRTVNRLFERIREAQEARRATETLSKMDDHLLRDIGVTREQAVRLARGIDD